ncbi:MAG: VOC family protein [Flammeovirgaceae bacterium]
MAKINPYLTFTGNCEEAFNFYKSIFGGDFTFLGRFSEMPPNPEFAVPDDMKQKIMHVSLPISAETVLMGSDTSEAFGQKVVVGNNFSVSIDCDSKEETDKLFHALSEGGKVTMPLENTFWGDYFGMFTDKFGIQWMVSCAINQEQQ